MRRKKEEREKAFTFFFGKEWKRKEGRERRLISPGEQDKWSLL